LMMVFSRHLSAAWLGFLYWFMGFF
jgi:hypothetical protein